MDDKETKVFLKEYIINPRMKDSVDVIVPPCSKNHGRMGTAIDYAIRFGLIHRTSIAEHHTYLISQISVHGFIRQTNPELYKTASIRLEEAIDTLFKYEINESKYGRKAAFSSMVLADYDVMFRTRNTTLPSPITDEQTQEIIQLMHLVPWDFFEQFGNISLNPSFGNGTKRLGGADADIIADDLLIDIKTTVQPKLTLEMVRQLVGYALLCNHFGITTGKDETTPHQIKRVGIYFARSSHMYITELSNCIAKEHEQIVLNYLLNHKYAKKDVEI
tara:strand:- start:93 stop:917 length:825 start_codon:yes stop_codon:yes gene_type:complete